MLPDLKDAEAVQKFFLEEIQLGEELLAQGEYEKGVDHLTNAIAVCGQPQQLLQVLQQTLPPPVFQMLLTKLPTISQFTVTVQLPFNIIGLVPPSTDTYSPIAYIKTLKKTVEGGEFERERDVTIQEGPFKTTIPFSYSPQLLQEHSTIGKFCNKFRTLKKKKEEEVYGRPKAKISFLKDVVKRQRYD
ncbi:hypothetical protein M91_20714 [Bos mutus]|uniref:Mitochondrial import receptor subunit TOM20 homolog n=1 Tax=Bos mutus TaxID=72004 RepID=L8HV57_9CETA|nr:hypothetical protein M91_20714 [Bos mutus]